MKKIRKTKLICLTAALGIAASGTMLHAASLTKTLKALYSNIAISYNGQNKLLSTQPFVSNGITYVPLRAIGEIMGANVNWSNNTIYINDQSTSAVSYAQEIAAKNFEIASLKQQLDTINAQLASNTVSAVSGNLTTDAVNKTLSEIEADYEDDYNIDWNFDLEIVSDRLELTVSYDSDDDSSDFNDMSESERKSFIKNICESIEQNHNAVQIKGTLEDSYKDDEIADFTYSTSGTLTYTENSATSLSDMENSLESDYITINCVNFSASASSIALSESDDELNVTITTSLSSYSGNWNDLISTNEDALYDSLESYFEDIIYDIEYEFDSYDEINITLKDSSLGTMAYYNDGYLNLYTVN